MIYIIRKIGGKYSVTSHHESITQDIIDLEKLGDEPKTFATPDEVTKNRWIEIWVELGDQTVTFFNDQITQPLYKEHEEIERSIREYLPLRRIEKLDILGI